MDTNLIEIEKIIRDIFPAAEAAIVCGSTGKDFIPGISDLDVVIIGPEDDAVDQKLIETMRASHELDPFYLPRKNLEKGNYCGRKADENYELHTFDLFRISIQGRRIFGDPKILKLFPKVQLKEALLDTSPYIRDVFIHNLRESINKTEDTNSLITENMNILLVISRAIYHTETQTYGSKTTAMEYLKRRYESFTKLMEYLEKRYLKQTITDERVEAKEVNSFLDYSQKVITEYLNKIG